MKENPHLLIGVPCMDMCHTEFMHCLWAIGRSYVGRQGVVLGKSSIVAHARSNIVEAAITVLEQQKFEYVLFLDSDMSFPQDVCHQLLKHKKDIVGATYPRRGPPFDNLGKAKYEADMKRKIDGGLVEMLEMPGGCLLVNLDVFRKLGKPYFRYGLDIEKQHVIGEDTDFCRRAVEAGYRIWCDIDLSKQLKHWYTFPLMTEDFATRKLHSAAMELDKTHGSASAA